MWCDIFLTSSDRLFVYSTFSSQVKTQICACPPPSKAAQGCQRPRLAIWQHAEPRRRRLDTDGSCTVRQHGETAAKLKENCPCLASQIHKCQKHGSVVIMLTKSPACVLQLTRGGWWRWWGIEVKGRVRSGVGGVGTLWFPPGSAHSSISLHRPSSGNSESGNWAASFHQDYCKHWAFLNVPALRTSVCLCPDRLYSNTTVS